MQVSTNYDTNYDGIDFKPRTMKARWQLCVEQLKKKPETLTEIRTIVVGMAAVHQADSDDPDAMGECQTDSDPE